MKINEEVDNLTVFELIVLLKYKRDMEDSKDTAYYIDNDITPLNRFTQYGESAKYFEYFLLLNEIEHNSNLSRQLD